MMLSRWVTAARSLSQRYGMILTPILDGRSNDMKDVIPLALLILAFAASGIAQENVIDRAGYDLLMQRYRRPPAEWQGVARRITSETTDTTTGRNTISSTLKQVKEFDAKGNVRRVSESTVNGQTTRTETITVGAYTFSKRDLEKWKPVSAPADRPNDINAVFETQSENAREGTWVEPGAKVEFRVAAGEHKGEAVLICTRIQKMEKVDPSTGAKVDREIVNRYWLSDKSRRIVKFEQITTSKGANLETRSVTASEWQTDPGIVIKAPMAAITMP